MLSRGDVAVMCCVAWLVAGCGRIGFEEIESVDRDAAPDDVFDGEGAGGMGGPPMDAGVDGGPMDASIDDTTDPGMPTDAEVDVDGDPIACTPANEATVCNGLPCVDGYCCDSLCDSECEACNLGGSEGVCALVPDGDDDALTGTACDGPDSDLCQDDAYGTCSGGTVSCSSGSDDIELCDGIDNDCDASTPDGDDEATLGNVCDGDDADLCASGTIACDSASLYCTDLAGDDPELCDGIDNDCNGATLDGADEATLGDACDGADSDQCDEGVLACSGGALSCTDTTGDNLELCDGNDNDCNGATPDGADEGTLGVACDGADSDRCDEGTVECSGGTLSCNDTTGDNLELCDGNDNDCVSGGTRR